MMITNEEEYRKVTDRWLEIGFILSQDDLDKDERKTLIMEQIQLEIEMEKSPFIYDEDDNIVRKYND